MKLRHVAVAGAAVALILVTLGGVASAQVLSGPTSTACTEARGVLSVKLKAVLDLNPDVLNGATTATDLTLGKLAVIKADADLGEGGQAVVAAAISAQQLVDRLCAPVDTSTPTPTPTTTPPTTTTTAPCSCTTATSTKTTTATSTKTKEKDSSDGDDDNSDDSKKDSDDGDSNDGDSDAGVSLAPTGGVATGLA